MPDPKTTLHQNELAGVLAAHRLWLASGFAEGSCANLSGMQLVDADLRGIDLRGADLSHGSLAGADLREADLRGANLFGADLSGAKLGGADLSCTRLTFASLRAADLRGASLRFADLSAADLRGVETDDEAREHLVWAHKDLATRLPEYYELVRSYSPKDGVHYPDADGYTVPPNGLQGRVLLQLNSILSWHFAYRERVTVMLSSYVYFEKGNPEAAVWPDLSVVLDHKRQGTEAFQTWVEGRVPDFVLDTLPPLPGETLDMMPASNRMKWDVEWLKRGYASAGIEEVFCFQSDPDFEGQRLQGWRLHEGRYLLIQPDRRGELRSLLGVSLREDGIKIRVRDTASGKDYVYEHGIVKQV